MQYENLLRDCIIQENKLFRLFLFMHKDFLLTQFPIKAEYKKLPKLSAIRFTQIYLLITSDMIVSYEGSGEGEHVLPIIQALPLAHVGLMKIYHIKDSFQFVMSFQCWGCGCHWTCFQQQNAILFVFKRHFNIYGSVVMEEKLKEPTRVPPMQLDM